MKKLFISTSLILAFSLSSLELSAVKCPPPQDLDIIPSAGSLIRAKLRINDLDLRFSELTIYPDIKKSELTLKTPNIIRLGGTDMEQIIGCQYEYETDTIDVRLSTIEVVPGPNVSKEFVASAIDAYNKNNERLSFKVNTREWVFDFSNFKGKIEANNISDVKQSDTSAILTLESNGTVIFSSKHFFNFYVNDRQYHFGIVTVGDVQ